MLVLVLVIEMSVFGLSLEASPWVFTFIFMKYRYKNLRRIDVVDSLGRKILRYLLDI